MKTFSLFLHYGIRPLGCRGGKRSVVRGLLINGSMPTPGALPTAAERSKWNVTPRWEPSVQRTERTGRVLTS